MLDILYVTGRGGSLDKGLSMYLKERADTFDGVAVDVSFLKQAPLAQVEFIQAKLKEKPERLIIANSYGAYLTLQSLVECSVRLKHVLLLSPVLGIAQAKDRMYMSRPPLTGRLKEAFETITVNAPDTFKILIGGQDELYNDQQLAYVESYFGKGSIIVLENESHMIEKSLISAFLDEQFGVYLNTL